jgi:pimeloyl-ACP methyl ester carboxylesterase
MKSKLFRTLRSLAVPYAVLTVLVGALQRFLIYHPSHESEPVMLAHARVLRCEPWRDSDGAIVGWKSVQSATPPAANRLVVFHGNAGYALHRAHYLAGFEALDDGRTWEVLLFEYPGYGARPGELGEKPFIEAGIKALDSLAAADARPIYLLGESLGSGLACALAAREPQRVAGLFLVTPYARLVDVAAHHYGFLPVRWMVRDSWNNVAALRGFSGPLAMLIAGEDEVVTPAQGRLLFDQFGGPKRLWIEAGGHHNTLDFSPGAPWWHEVSDFLLRRTSARLSSP